MKCQQKGCDGEHHGLPDRADRLYAYHEVSGTPIYLALASYVEIYLCAKCGKWSAQSRAIRFDESGIGREASPEDASTGDRVAAAYGDLLRSIVKDFAISEDTAARIAARVAKFLEPSGKRKTS